MIVKQLEDVVGTEHDVDTATWFSRRLLLRRDGAGFSLHDTTMKPGTETEMWYKNHVEAVYCIEGEGELEVLDENRTYPVKPGTLYVLDGHEKHKLRSKTALRVVCVFNPPCAGTETHDADGSYALGEPDAYPSRVGPEPVLLERDDPVVYDKVVRQPFVNAAQLDDYEKDGYLFLENFFSAEEVETMRAELKRVWREAADDERPEVIREPDSNAVRSVFAVHRDSPVFRQTAAHERLTAIVRQILGSSFYVHQSRINFKPGFTGKDFYWHSDFETWHVEDGMPRMRALSCSIALEDNYAFNGPLMVIPGSHRRFVSCVGRTPEGHYLDSLRKQQYGVPDPDSLSRLAAEGGIVAPVGKAGSVLLFDCNVMHGSSSNISPYPRSNVFLVFNSTENRLVEPYSGQAPRPDYIAVRE
ncbi:ectoine hydroxylase [Paenibacillus hodogayensis]|uniref:L-ectoine synthase n=1 Tax=Paenibacillus hodogayensis TaxID=279208 RepID=A0ABV5VU43_9BACL